MLNIKNSVLLAALTLTRMLTGLGIAKAIAVQHGATGVGFLGHLQGITGLIAGLIAAPLGNGLIRAVAAAANNNKLDQGLQYWREALRISIFFAACGAVVLGIFYHPLMAALSQNGVTYTLLLIAIITAPFQALTTAFQSLLNGLGKLRELSHLGIKGTLAIFIISIISIFTGEINQGLAITLVSITTQTAIFAYYFRHTSWLRPNLPGSKSHTNKIRKDIFGFAAMAVTSALLIPGAQIIIRSLIADHNGWEAVGYWQAAQRLSDAHLSLLGTILSTQLLPRLVQTEHTKATSTIVKGTALSGIMLIPGALLLVIFGESIVRLLFSDALLPATQVLKYQVTADLFRALSWPASYYLISKAQLRTFCIAEGIFSATWLLGASILSGTYGWISASIAYFAASAANLFFLAITVAMQLRKN